MPPNEHQVPSLFSQTVISTLVVHLLWKPTKLLKTCWKTVVRSFVEFLSTVLKLCPTKSCANFFEQPDICNQSWQPAFCIKKIKSRGIRNTWALLYYGISSWSELIYVVIVDIKPPLLEWVVIDSRQCSHRYYTAALWKLQKQQIQQSKQTCGGPLKFSEKRSHSLLYQSAKYICNQSSQPAFLYKNKLKAAV